MEEGSRVRRARKSRMITGQVGHLDVVPLGPLISSVEFDELSLNSLVRAKSVKARNNRKGATTNR